MSQIAKSVIFDLTDIWGATDYMGIGGISFYLNDVEVPLSGYVINTGVTLSGYSSANIFNPLKSFVGDCTTDKRICFALSGTVSAFRISLSFNNPIEFDEIRQSNVHCSGANTNRGVKNAIIYVSSDAIYSTIYGDPIVNSDIIADNVWSEHTSGLDDADWQSVFLDGSPIIISNDLILSGQVDVQVGAIISLPGGLNLSGIVNARSLNEGNDFATKLLIHSLTVDNDTLFIDSSSSAHSINTIGDAHHETDQSKFSDTSIFTDGIDDALIVPDHSDFNILSENYAIDFWLFPVDVPNGDSYGTIISKATTTYLDGDNDFTCFWRPAAQAILWNHYYTGGNSVKVLQSLNNSVPPNTWSHIAITYDGITLRIFVNGVLSTSSLMSGAMNNGASDINIGAIFPFDDWSYETQCYIDELRVSVGDSRWIDDFTPPTTVYGIPIESSKFDGNFLIGGSLEVYTLYPLEFAIGGAFAIESTVVITPPINMMSVNGKLILGADIVLGIQNNKINGSFILESTIDIINSQPVNILGSFLLSGEIDSLKINKDVFIEGSFILTGVIVCPQLVDNCSLPIHDSSRWC